MGEKPVQFCSVLKFFQESITCGFAVVAAVVLATEQVAGFGVDGDALAVGPVAAFNVEVVAEGAQPCEGFRGEAGLEVELVGQVLVVEARGVDGLLYVEAALGC